MRTKFLLAAFAIGITTTSFSQPKRTLLAISKVDHTLSVVDPVTLKVIAKMPVGEDPHEVIASADGKTAYVSNTGYGSFHELNILDLVAQKPSSNFDTQPLLGPHGMSIVDDKLWFTAQGSKSIARYDPVAGKVDWVMGTGQGTTHMLYVSRDGKKVYTTNVESGTVSIFENMLVPPMIPPTGVLPPTAKPRMDWVHTIVATGKGSEGLDVSLDEKELWTATPDGRVAIVNLDTKTLDTSFDAKLPGAHRLRFTPDGRRVFVVSVRTGDLAVFDVKTRKEIKRINIGHGAAMLMDSVGDRVFISCTPDNYIAIVSLKTLEIVRRLDVGGRPDGLAWAVQP